MTTFPVFARLFVKSFQPLSCKALFACKLEDEGSERRVQEILAIKLQEQKSFFYRLTSVFVCIIKKNYISDGLKM